MSGVGKELFGGVRSAPQWSPDGEQLGALVGMEGAISVQIVDVASGEGVPASKESTATFTLLPNNGIVTASGSTLTINMQGQSPVAVAMPCQQPITAIVPAPDTRALAVTCGEAQIFVVPLDTPSKFTRVGAGSAPHWAA